eukprot:CAMPEP_0115838708 /NCGR_PEP_ID=MMETSP0287-20121206/5871_1 /TAXON_ID=412157 /ORGANISM="Chrysochromulina rotalis, Strain UIO044" /LENGTH=222 /DNA_ID=CAMNT_0003292249 /DNA_START=556 /DNA_END=1220 /DNA_ORIENTATION=+
MSEEEKRRQSTGARGKRPAVSPAARRRGGGKALNFEKESVLEVGNGAHVGKPADCPHQSSGWSAAFARCCSIHRLKVLAQTRSASGCVILSMSGIGVCVSADSRRIFERAPCTPPRAAHHPTLSSDPGRGASRERALAAATTWHRALPCDQAADPTARRRVAPRADEAALSQLVASSSSNSSNDAAQASRAVRKLVRLKSVLTVLATDVSSNCDVGVGPLRG